MTDVIVIGGGVIGLMSAWRLAQAGLSVQLFEKGKCGMESSYAALGVLTAQSPIRSADLTRQHRATAATPAEHMFNLSRASLALHPAVAAELQAQTDVNVGLRDEGMLYAALNDRELNELRAEFRAQRAAGVPVDLLSESEAHALEPALSEDVCGALHFTATLQVDNRKLCQALMVAAARMGAQIHEGQIVTQVVRDGYGVTGVQLGSDKRPASWVVMAAGSWSGSIEGVNLPLRPMKGQAFAVDASSIAPLTITRTIDSVEGYVVPRKDGRLLIGATVEDVGFDKQVQDRAMQELLAGAIRVVPALKNATVLERWTGLRPYSADGLPIIGPVPDCAGFIAATGHFRNGILLAPITAQLVTEWVTDKTPSLDMQAFAPDRFGDEVVEL